MVTNFANVLERCEQASGSGSRSTIANSLASADEIARHLICEALNPYRVFGIAAISQVTPAQATHADAYCQLFDLLDALHSRNITGNAARDEVARVLGLFDAYEQPFVVRAIQKDLRAKFSADTFNKAIGCNYVPTFDVMLADKCDDVSDFERHISFPCQADFKYDGERNIAVVRDGSVVFYNRSGKQATHMDGLFDAELARLRDHLGYDFVLDGERIASDFTETVNAKKAGNDAAKNNLKFRAFFLMPLDHWIAQRTEITMRQARNHLIEILEQIGAQKIVVSEGREVASYADMMEFCNEAIDVHKVEGLILKDWKSTYQWDRTFAWTKVKRFYDVDCRVMSTYEGRKGTRHEGRLGGVEAVGFLESGERVEVNVGSGFSDDERSQTDWVGQTIVVKYQDVTRNKNKSVASLRFPTFSHRRDDKVVEVDQ